MLCCGRSPPSAGERRPERHVGMLAVRQHRAVTKLQNGAKRLTYEIGPFNIVPGQNEIGYEPITEKPQVDGWITRIRPDLIYMNGKVPARGRDPPPPRRVAQPGPPATATRPGLPELFFAAGEEKTIVQLPEGLRLPPTRRRTAGSSTT